MIAYVAEIWLHGFDTTAGGNTGSSTTVGRDVLSETSATEILRRRYLFPSLDVFVAGGLIKHT